jgi:hypothetical protein
MPITRVDCALDALPVSFKLGRLNGVARGAYMYYDAHAMHGLPVAVQVVGRRLQEEMVLAAMERIEAAMAEHGTRYGLLEVE